MSNSGLAAALGLTKASSYEIDKSTNLDVSAALNDGDIEICLKKLFKKDATTKLKGLHTLLDLLSHKPGRILVAYLPAWTRLYRLLCVDEDDRRVRCLAHQVMLQWVDGRGPKLKKLFRHLTPDFVALWLCARFDPCPLAADAALLAWQALVPSANLPRFLLRHLPLLLDTLPTLLSSSQTLPQLKAAHPLLDPDALDRLYDRQLATALRALAFLLATLAADDALAARLHQLMDAPPFWKLFASPRPPVRLACYHFLQTLCLAHPRLLEDPKQLKAAALALFKGFDALDQPATQAAFWPTLLRFLSHFAPLLFDHLSPKNALLPPLFKHLAASAPLAPDVAYPSLLVLLSLLPRPVLLDPDFVRAFFAALFRGFDAQPLQRIAGPLATAIAQCLLYLLALDLSPPVVHHLLHDVLPHLLQMALRLELRGTESPFVVVEQVAFVLKKTLLRLPSESQPAPDLTWLPPFQAACVAHLLAAAAPPSPTAPASNLSTSPAFLASLDRLTFLIHSLRDDLSDDLKALLTPLLHQIVTTLFHRLPPSVPALTLVKTIFHSFLPHLLPLLDQWHLFLTELLLDSPTDRFADPAFLHAFVDACLFVLQHLSTPIQHWNALVQTCAAQPHLLRVLPVFLQQISDTESTRSWQCPALDEHVRLQLTRLTDPAASRFLVAFVQSPLFTPEFHTEFIAAWLQPFSQPSPLGRDQLLALLALAHELLMKVVDHGDLQPLLVQLFRLRTHGFESSPPLTDHDSSDSNSDHDLLPDEDSSEIRRLLPDAPVARMARRVWQTTSLPIRVALVSSLPPIFQSLLEALYHSRIPASVLAEELVALLRIVGWEASSPESVATKELLAQFFASLTPLSPQELQQALRSLMPGCFAEFQTPLRFSESMYLSGTADQQSLLWRRVQFLERLLVSLDSPTLIFPLEVIHSSSSSSSSSSLIQLNLLCEMLYAYTLADFFVPEMITRHPHTLSADALHFLGEANLFWNVRKQIIEPLLQRSFDYALGVFQQLLSLSLDHGELWSLTLGTMVPILLHAGVEAEFDSYDTLVLPACQTVPAGVATVASYVKANLKEHDDVLVLSATRIEAALRAAATDKIPLWIEISAAFLRSVDLLNADSSRFTRNKRLMLDMVQQEAHRAACAAFLPAVLLALCSDATTRKHLLVSHAMPSVLEWIYPYLQLHTPPQYRATYDALSLVQLILGLDEAEQLGQLQEHFHDASLFLVLELVLTAPLPTSPALYELLRLACIILHRHLLSKPLPSPVLTLIASKLNELSAFLVSHLYELQVLASVVLSLYWSGASISLPAPVQSTEDTLPADEAELFFFPPAFRALVTTTQPSPSALPSSSDADAAGDPESTDLAALFGTLLAWKVIIDLRLNSGHRELCEILTAQVRRGHAYEGILRVILNHQPHALVPLTTAPGALVLPPSLDSPYTVVEPDVVDELCSYLMYGFLRGFPGVIRMWVSDLADRNLKKRVQNLVIQRYSSLLRQLEMQSIRDYNLPARSSFSISPALTNDEAKALYVHDEVTLSVVFKLPATYPLQPIQIETVQRMGIAEALWRRWILSMVSMMATQDAQLIDSVLLWKNCMDKHFEGIESCFICYSVFHPTNKSLPRMACRTCKNKFHSACLFRWFSTSHKSACPLCQTPWLT